MVKLLQIELNKLQDVLRLQGIDHRNGKIGVNVGIYLTTLLAVIINIIFYILNKWNDIGERIGGFKMLVLVIMCGLYAIVIIFNWESFTYTIRAILESSRKHPGNPELDHPTVVSIKRTELKNQTRKDMLSLNNIWFYSTFSFVLLTQILPSVILLAYTLIKVNMNEIDIDKLRLPYPVFYPEHYKSIWTYIVAYIIQNTAHIFGVSYAYLGNSSCTTAMRVLVGDFKLLCLTVQELKQDGYQSSTNYWQERGVPGNNLILRYVIETHQAIYRKAKKITKGIVGIVFVLNSGFSIQLCMTVFTIVQSDELLVKCRELIFCSIWIYLIYCYDLHGEKIATENENLRRELYYSLWIDKPNSYKKELLIIMARTNKSIEIKPVGLFTLNLRNFAVSVNATYSYYNVLCNFKK